MLRLAPSFKVTAFPKSPAAAAEKSTDSAQPRSIAEDSRLEAQAYANHFSKRFETLGLFIRLKPLYLPPNPAKLQD